MARRTTSDHLPEPGDDAEIAAQVAAAGIDPALAPAAAHRAEAIRRTAHESLAAEVAEPVPSPYVALVDVGPFRAGQRVAEGHWSDARLAALLAGGKIAPAQE